MAARRYGAEKNQAQLSILCPLSALIPCVTRVSPHVSQTDLCLTCPGSPASGKNQAEMDAEIVNELDHIDRKHKRKIRRLEHQLLSWQCSG